ncbi:MULTISPECIES: TetR/AcrR family transcriptional regulator [Rhodobacterales]|uniref:TetR/AcrR family transcriptional regulator n=1 Tax=Roseobacter sp. N2S TaxID=2663844 RepID=UPI00285867EA|nr:MULTISPECIES: TetR/AcrR family transcriptional regulator [Rhodobacterales]MDR6264612.1 AcrR family transcriptional regulator [Roseobacter sp. N2S]
MTDIQNQIDAGLERAFAKHGFAEPNIETLRKATGVSLRTLYKYVPSRDVMILRALEHRHWRYMAHLFPETENADQLPFATIVDRVAQWMKTETTHGCLFHAAVASSPQDEDLRRLLNRHKAEMADRAANASGLTGREGEISVIVEGLMQSWPLRGEEAVSAAKALGALICGGEGQQLHELKSRNQT